MAMQCAIGTKSLRSPDKAESPSRNDGHVSEAGIARKNAGLRRSNAKHAKDNWGTLSKHCIGALAELTDTYGLSVSAGHLQLLEGCWYVTHSGLLQVAQRRRCLGIRTILQERQSDPIAGRWVFKATVYKSARSRGFVGFGDADPLNVSPLVRGAEMRVALTGPFVRRTALEFAPSRNWVARPDLRNALRNQRIKMSSATEMARTTVSPDCGISSAC